MHLLLINTLGLSILEATMVDAAQVVYLKDTGSNASYLFVQGTGLDILLGSYGLDLDPFKLRDGFNYYLKRKKRDHEERPSLSHHLSSQGTADL